jgi:hypothetical protein
LGALLIFGLYFFVYNPFQANFNSLEKEISSKKILLKTYRTYSQKLPSIIEEYSNRLIPNKEIINKIYEKIKESDIQLKSLSNRKIGEDLRVKLKINGTFREINQFYGDFINSINYRPQIITMTIEGTGNKYLSIETEFNFK